MDDYHKFSNAHEADIKEWHHYWLPNYFSIIKGRLVANIIRAGVGPSMHGVDGSSLTHDMNSFRF
jgi:hypothetical protein